MANLLGKTSLRIAKLPATGSSGKRKITVSGKTSPSQVDDGKAEHRHRRKEAVEEEGDKSSWGMDTLMRGSSAKGTLLSSSIDDWLNSLVGPGKYDYPCSPPLQDC